MSMKFFIPDVRNQFFEDLRDYVINDNKKNEVKILNFSKKLSETLIRMDRVHEKEIQRFISESDIKNKYTQILTEIESFRNLVDSQIFECFEEIQFDEGRDFIEVDVVSNEVEAGIVLPGEAIQFSKFKSETITAKEIQIAAGIEIPLQILETRQYARLYDKIKNSAIAYYSKKYKILYELIYNAANQNTPIAYQPGANEVERTIKTINVAINQLRNDFKDYVTFSNAFPVYIFANPSLEGRLRLALNYNGQFATASEIVVNQNIQLRSTFNFSNLTNTQAVFVVPYITNKFAERVQPNVLNQFNLTNLSQMFAIRGSFAAVVAYAKTAVIVNFA